MPAVNKVMLHRPKRRLAVAGENLWDRPALLAFDLMVAVEQPKAQPVGHRPPDGGLARPHEAHKIEIYGARLHCTPFTQGPRRPVAKPEKT